MLAYCLSLWGFVCKYIWLQMQPFITIHPATAGALLEKWPSDALLPKPQCSWLPDSASSPASGILKMISAVVEYYNKE